MKDFDDTIRQQFAAMRRPLPEILGSPWMLEQLRHRVCDELSVVFPMEMIHRRLLDLVDGPAPREQAAGTR